ncbi:MAG: hypothetical protein RLZZ326_3644, partial [Planctomycetota bacterium]
MPAAGVAGSLHRGRAGGWQRTPPEGAKSDGRSRAKQGRWHDGDPVSASIGARAAVDDNG